MIHRRTKKLIVIELKDIGRHCPLFYEDTLFNQGKKFTASALMVFHKLFISMFYFLETVYCITKVKLDYLFYVWQSCIYRNLIHA